MDRIRGSFGKHEGSLRNWSGDFRICAWKWFNCFISSFHGSFVLIGKPFSFTMEVLICSRRINVLVLNFYKHTRCYCWFCDDFKAVLQNYWAVYVFHNYTGLFFSTLPKKRCPLFKQLRQPSNLSLIYCRRETLYIFKHLALLSS